MSTPRQQHGGLSATTLAIASLASVAAAIVVREVWRSGAILGAALTPVIVAIVSESLRRPVDRVSAIRDERRTRTRVQTPRGAAAPPPPELERPDPFGIWQDPPRERRLKPRHLKIALATGVVAFLVGTVGLTGIELVFGGNLGGGGDRVTIVPSGGGKDNKERQTTTETEPQEEPSSTDTTATQPTQPTVPPDTTTEPAPTATTPPPTPTPTTPTPAPPGETAPAPAPEAPPGG